MRLYCDCWGAAGGNLSSGVIGGIAVVGFVLLGLMLAACSVLMRQKIRSQRLSVSTQSLIAPGQIITDGSRLNSPLTARRMSQQMLIIISLKQINNVMTMID